VGICLLWVLCCQVDVSGSDWSLVQMSPTECGACECVCLISVIKGNHNLYTGNEWVHRG